MLTHRILCLAGASLDEGRRKNDVFLSMGLLGTSSSVLSILRVLSAADNVAAKLAEKSLP